LWRTYKKETKSPFPKTLGVGGVKEKKDAVTCMGGAVCAFQDLCWPSFVSGRPRKVKLVWQKKAKLTSPLAE